MPAPTPAPRRPCGGYAAVITRFVEPAPAHIAGGGLGDCQLRFDPVTPAVAAALPVAPSTASPFLLFTPSRVLGMQSPPLAVMQSTKVGGPCAVGPALILTTPHAAVDG
jgi:hypothetical protein